MCIEAAKIARSNKEELKIGYLRCYTEVEFHRALELFSEKHPDVEMSVAYGNHEELYNLLRTGNADIVLNDQRRAFSDEYVNLILTTCRSYIEVSSHSSLAQTEHISPSELKNTPCILVASETQRETAMLSASAANFSMRKISRKRGSWLSGARVLCRSKEQENQHPQGHP